jgi:osmoprotectant transport system permease protein
VDFLASFFDPWQQLYHTWLHTEDFWEQTWIFLSLTLRGLGLVLLLGLPLGIVLTRLPRVAGPVVAVLALVQPIPSLALIGLLYSLVPIGAPAALFAAVVYSLFPVVLNTVVGITQVPPAVRDAARGMGMTGRQVLWHVELPLALPVILAGVRTSLVYVIGIMAIAAFLGAGGLGDYILSGVNRGDNASIYLGVVPMLLITFLFLGCLGGIAYLARRSSSLGMTLGGGLVILLAGYAVAEPLLRPRRPDVVIGGKNFIEGRILSEMFRLLLQAHTDLSVGVRHNLGSKLAYKSLLRGDIDLYPEYTGNLLTGEDALAGAVGPDQFAVLGPTHLVAQCCGAQDLAAPAGPMGSLMPTLVAAKVGEDRAFTVAAVTGFVRQQMRRGFRLDVLRPLGLNNTYAPSTTKATARRYRLRKISDLRGLPELRVAVDIEFKKRADGWAGLVKKYGLRFRRPPIQVSPDLLYKPLETGQADVVIGFATDWQIEANGLVVLKDDKHYFPSYLAVPLVRESVLGAHPEIRQILNKLAGRISDATMRRLNYEVAVGGRSAEEVAREFLERQKLLP